MTSKRGKRTSKVGYLDASLPADDRVRDLLGRMTLEEKIREMGMWISSFLMKRGKFSPALAKAFFKGMGIGAMEDPRISPRLTVKAVNAIQRYIKAQTRLGIPTIFISECLHGHMSHGATVFPQAIGLASTWNVGLMERMASVTAKEARAVGISQALSPDLDLAREGRWGRTEETYGEDPYLCSRMAVAFVRGLQGRGPGVDRDHLIATLKHFAAHGSPEAGMNLGPVTVGPRELRELYLVPFKAAIVEAGALSVMPAYSEIDGIPCSSSQLLLQKILREEWGFQGYTFSDYSALSMLKTLHRTASTFQEAGRQGLTAGVDLEAPIMECYGDRLLSLVRRGQVSVDLINQAASRVLRAKFLAGLFENPYADERQVVRIVNRPEHRKLAREIAQESIVLLKNKGSLLPLDRRIGSIAVLGPNAAVAQLGDYSVEKDEVVSPLEGIRRAVTRKTKVTYVEGCDIRGASKDGFGSAVAAAERSQVAILVVGGISKIRRIVGGEIKEQPGATCGENRDRAELGLPGVQQELVEAVVATGTPTVVILVNGRPYSIPWIVEHVPAILEAWYPGEEGGNALADILFGKVNPSGKLPISVPRTVGQVPVFYNHKPSARGWVQQPDLPVGAYVFTPGVPLFRFGYGLSYTTFKYSDLRVTPSKIRPAGKVTVSVKVRNTGKREGKEVVQLYINDVVSSVATRVKVLRRFEKINLKPGRTRRVRFELAGEDLELLNEHFERVVEPGVFDVMVGPLKKRFEVR